MSSIELKPKFVKGNVNIPTSKSVSHRVLIASALSNKRTIIKNICFSDDINATIDALKCLGYSIVKNNDYVIINDKERIKTDNVIINANESGSTLRFLLPLTVSLGVKCTFIGNGNLPKRSLDIYFEMFNELGIKYQNPSDAYLPLKILNTKDFTEVNIKCSVSSQFVSGLMLCGMIKPIKIYIIDELQSKNYVDITAKVLKDFGCIVSFLNNKTITVEFKKSNVEEYIVEKDWSQCANFLCAGAINGDVTVSNMNLYSAQGDKQIIDILKGFNANITVNDNNINVLKSNLKAINIDARNIPDLVPVLSVVACYAQGKTVIKNVNRLRFKESDRLLAIYQELSKLGADISYTDNEIVIYGGKTLTGTNVSSHNDHRIAMALSVTSVGCFGNVIIEECESVNKSYPNFFKDWSNL